MGATTNNYSGNRIRCLPRQRQSQAQALRPSQGKAGMRGVACGTPPPPGMLRFVRPVPGSRYTMRRSSSWTMTCRLINFYNCMHSFQCGFEVVFTVNVHCLFYVFFYFFYLQLFYSLCVFDTSSYLIGLYLFPLSIEHCLIFFILTMKQLL